jgi:hypothetical protein
VKIPCFSVRLVGFESCQPSGQGLTKLAHHHPLPWPRHCLLQCALPCLPGSSSCAFCMDFQDMALCSMEYTTLPHYP